MLDRIGIWIEETMTDTFTRLGTACAQYPIPVIVMSIGFAAGLCTGIQWLEVKLTCSNCLIFSLTTMS